MAKRADQAEQDLISARSELEQRTQQFIAEQAKANEAQALAQREWEERVAAHRRDLEQKEREIAALVCTLTICLLSTLMCTYMKNPLYLCFFDMSSQRQDFCIFFLVQIDVS